jgi:hypothetical protein
MKHKTYLLNTLLATVFGGVCMTALLLSTFAPAVIIPTLNIPNMALISLLALLLDHYLAPDTERCYICIALLSALTFGLFPYAAGFVTIQTALVMALVGGITFTSVTFLFTSIQDRLSSGPAAKAAPLLSAFGLYLAFQCLTGIIL